MVNLPEIVIILVTMGIIFGLGKLGDIGKVIANFRLRHHKALESGYVDITPPQSEAGAARGAEYRPGTRPQSVEDAQIEDPSQTTQDKEE